MDQPRLTPSNLIISTYDIFRKTLINGEEGGIRVTKVKQHYGFVKTKNGNILTKPITLRELSEITEICDTWRKETEIMPFRKVYLEQEVTYIPALNTTSEIYTKYLKDNNIDFCCYKDSLFSDVERGEWDFKICCKRGNPVYLKMVRDKFKPLERWSKTPAASKRIGFSTITNKNRKRVKRGNLFLITLTEDHNIIKTPGESWLNSGKLLNSYLTYLRQEFPGIKFFVAPQAQKNGYFHPHVLAYLPDDKLTVYPHNEYNDKKKKWEDVWRIHNRQKHNGKLALDIFKSWNYGFSDVRAVDCLKKGLTEVLKYVTRELKGGEYNITQGALWFFGKQGYSMSDGFIDSLTGLSKDELNAEFGDIELAEPTNDNLINAEGVKQSNSTKSKLIRLEFFPPVLKRNLDFSYTKNILDPENVPDPPPDVVKYFDKLACSCFPVSIKKVLRDDGSALDIVVYKYSDDPAADESLFSNRLNDFSAPCCECGAPTDRCILGVYVCKDCYSPCSKR